MTCRTTKDWKFTRLPLTGSSVLIRYTNTREQKKIFLNITVSASSDFRKQELNNRKTTTDSLFEHLPKDGDVWRTLLKEFSTTEFQLPQGYLNQHPRSVIKSMFPRHWLCKTSTGTQCTGWIFYYPTLNKDNLAKLFAARLTTINNFVLMANTAHYTKHNRSCRATAVFTVEMVISRFLFHLFLVQNITFLLVPISILNWSSLPKAFWKARVPYCLGHLYPHTGWFFQIALYSIISCCENMYITIYHIYPYVYALA